MSGNKTKPTAASVDEFLEKIPDEQTGTDCRQLIEIMRAIVGEEPTLWGPSIVGFGTYHYVYDSGREGDVPLVGFSPRKQNLSLYLTCDIQRHQDLLDKLGTHSCGKGCLYLKRLSDVHLPTLKKLIQTSVKFVLENLAAQKTAVKPAKKKRKSG